MWTLKKGTDYALCASVPDSVPFHKFPTSRRSVGVDRAVCPLFQYAPNGRMAIMRNMLPALGTVLALALTSTALLAHHSFASEFDTAKPITVTGVVSKVEWTNPHTWFFVDGKDE